MTVTASALLQCLSPVRAATANIALRQRRRQRSFQHSAARAILLTSCISIPATAAARARTASALSAIALRVTAARALHASPRCSLHSSRDSLRPAARQMSEFGECAGAIAATAVSPAELTTHAATKLERADGYLLSPLRRAGKRRAIMRRRPLYAENGRLPSPSHFSIAQTSRQAPTAHAAICRYPASETICRTVAKRHVHIRLHISFI